MNTFKRTILFLSLIIVATAGFFQETKEIRRFKVESGKQGVAVDKDHFYEINNNTIIKYRKDTEKAVARWVGFAYYSGENATEGKDTIMAAERGV